MTSIPYSSVAIFLSLILTGCQFRASSPLGPELTTKDFETLTAPEERRITSSSHGKRTAAPTLPDAFKTKVSLHMVADIPLSALFEKLAAYLDVDIYLDKNIRNRKTSLSISNKSFVNVLENLCALEKLRYRFENGLLFIEPDLPFSRSYPLQFLNFVRSSENKISSGTDIFSHGMKPSEEGVVTSCHSGENGSNTSVSMSSASDFWKELEVNLQNLLAPAEGEEKARVAPFSLHKQAGVVSVWGTSEQHYRVREYLDLLRKSVSSQILVEAKVVEVTLDEKFKSGIDWGFLPANKSSANSTSSGGSSTSQDGTSTEQSYKNSFIGGHNFISSLSNTANSSITNLNITDGFIQYTASLEGGMMGIMKSLQSFGATKTLSSPRLTVMNNQSAVLKVAQNQVYFKLNYSRHVSTKSDYNDFSVGSDIQTIPVGLVMTVQPAIDPATNSVILFLRPTISRLVTEVSDPSMAIAVRQNNNSNTKDLPDSKVPIIEVKEIDSVLRLANGEVGILGGFMETYSAHSRNKYPFLGDVPVVKEVFSSLKKDDQLKELVILIRVKILDTPTLAPSDERLMHLYIRDPRPI